MKNKLLSLIFVFVMIFSCVYPNMFCVYAGENENLNVTSSVYTVEYSEAGNTISNIPVGTNVNVFLYNMRKDNPDYIIGFDKVKNSWENLSFYADRPVYLRVKKQNSDIAEEFKLIAEIKDEFNESFENYPLGVFSSNALWNEAKTGTNYGSAMICEESDGNRFHRYSCTNTEASSYKNTNTAVPPMILDSSLVSLNKGEKAELCFKVRKEDAGIYVQLRDANASSEGHFIRAIYNFGNNGKISCFYSTNYIKDSNEDRIFDDSQWVDFRIVFDRTNNDDSKNTINVYINGSESLASSKISDFSDFSWENFYVQFVPTLGKVESFPEQAVVDFDDISYTKAQKQTESGVVINEINTYSSKTAGDIEYAGLVVNGENRFKVTLTNNTDTDEPIYIFAAEKNNGKLVGVSVSEATVLSEKKENMSVTLDIKNAAQNDIEFFVWCKNELSPLNEVYNPSVADINKAISKPHPRVAATAKTFEEIASFEDDMRVGYREKVINRADDICKKFIGCDVTSPFYLGDTKNSYGNYYVDFSTVANRLKEFTAVLGLAYQIKEDTKYSDMLYKMLMVAKGHGGWTDGSLSNLTAGYMTEAYAIGFDWCYNGLSEEQRKDIADVIIDRCFSFALCEYENEARASHSWSVTYTNINAISNSSFITGAIAFSEYAPQLSQTILDYACERIKIFLSGLAPDGGWWEGKMYFDILLSHLVKASDTLEINFGSDDIISSSEFFAKVPDFIIATMGPCGVYNFAEQRDPEMNCLLEMLWFAKKYDRKDVRDWALEKIDFSSYKNCALSLLWLVDNGTEPYVFENYYGRGVEQITLGNGGEDNSSWLSVLGGVNMGQHKHLDLGSFIYDYNGVRWANELGLFDYYKGYQNSTSKDKIFYKARAEGHNTLEINPSSESGGQRMNDSNGISKGEVISYNLREDKPYAIYDLSTAYSDKASAVKRGFKLLDDNIGFIVRDEFTTIKEAGETAKDVVCWYMHTGAEIEISADGKSATLTKDGKTMKVTVLEENLTIEKTVAITPEPIYSELLAYSEEEGYQLDKQSSIYKDGFGEKLKITHTGSGEGTITVMVAPENVATPVDATKSLIDWN